MVTRKDFEDKIKLVKNTITALVADAHNLKLKNATGISEKCAKIQVIMQDITKLSLE